MGSRRLPALVFLASVLLLAGCGHARDPFVGTWRLTAGQNPGLRLIIWKVPGAYRVTMVQAQAGGHGNEPRFVRHGDKLVDDYGNGASGRRDVITYVPSTGHLVLRDESVPDNTLEWRRMNYSTALPTLSP